MGARVKNPIFDDLLRPHSLSIDILIFTRKWVRPDDANCPEWAGGAGGSPLPKGTEPTAAPQREHQAKARGRLAAGKRRKARAGQSEPPVLSEGARFLFIHARMGKHTGRKNTASGRDFPPCCRISPAPQ